MLIVLITGPCVISISGTCGVLRGDCSDMSESTEIIEEGDSMVVNSSLCMYVPACNVKAWSDFKHFCCSSSLYMSNTEDVHDKLSCSLLGPKMSSCLFVALDLGSLAFLLFLFVFLFLACVQ